MDMSSENMRSLRTGFKATFQKGLKSYTSLVMPFAEKISSDDEEEIYSWLSEVPSLKEWLGARQVKALSEYDYKVRNKPYEATIEVPRKKIERDKHNSYAIAIKGMGLAAAKWPTQLLTKAIVASFTSPCFDGQNFIDDDHPIYVAGKQQLFSNFQDGIEEPWILIDVNQPVLPWIFQEAQKPRFIVKDDPETSDKVNDNNKNYYSTDVEGAVGYAFWQTVYGSKAELTEANVNAAIDAMADLVNENGDPLDITPTHILIGNKNRSKAVQLFDLKTLAAGGDNSMYRVLKTVKVSALKKA
ncbi:MAG: Mu-like prophage major head subunit gpT family protein [Rhizobiales bacterium]|nr:Mu-like prophage major head subunit gpT family protein [Hyphomicrobiales bacterium]